MATAMARRGSHSELPPWPLEERPGFVIRRLHQTHVALFARECAAFDVTPVQYSLLSALAARTGSDLTTLAADVALDRTTTTGAVRRLQARGLVALAPSRRDRRAQACTLTERGREMLSAMETSVHAAHDATLSGLSARERETWLKLSRRVLAGASDAPPRA